MTSPFAEVRAMLGALTAMVAPPSLMVAFELMVTELVPVTLLPSVTVEPATVLAVSVTSKPLIVLLVASDAPVALTVKKFPAPLPDAL